MDQLHALSLSPQAQYERLARLQREALPIISYSSASPEAPPVLVVDAHGRPDLLDLSRVLNAEDNVLLAQGNWTIQPAPVEQLGIYAPTFFVGHVITRPVRTAFTLAFDIIDHTVPLGLIAYADCYGIIFSDGVPESGTTYHMFPTGRLKFIPMLAAIVAPMGLAGMLATLLSAVAIRTAHPDALEDD